MNRQCFTSKITLRERDCLYSLIKLVSKLFKKHNIIWIPTGGSLLAIYRHNKLTIPWDDDYDITIRNKDKLRAIKILKKNLPKYKANITFRHQWNGGLLYKIYWDNNTKFRDVVQSFDDKNKKYSWPFIDLFINVKNDFRSLGAFPLSKYDYPLKKKKIEGIEINIPTKGIRNYKSFLKKGHLHILKEQYWSHKYEKHMPCKGPKKIVRKINKDMLHRNPQLKVYLNKSPPRSQKIIMKDINHKLDKINKIIKSIKNR